MARLGDASVGYGACMTVRTNDLMTHAHGLADGASTIAAHVTDVIGSAVGDAASAVTDTATHVFGSLTSTIDQATGRTRARRQRTWLPLVAVLAVGAVFFALRRRRAAASRAAADAQPAGPTAVPAKKAGTSHAA